MVFLLLYINTRSWVKTFIVLLAAPFSAVGAIWLLYALGYHMSVGVWVGLIALLGVDAETGVFMLLYLDLAYEQARKEGRLRNRQELHQAILYGAVQRIRPKFMTVATTFAGLILILWPIGVGSDAMNRLAHLLLCAGLALGASKPGVKEVRAALEMIAWDTIGRTTEAKGGVVDVRPILRVEDFKIEEMPVKGSTAKVFVQVTVRRCEKMPGQVGDLPHDTGKLLMWRRPSAGVADRPNPVAAHRGGGDPGAAASLKTWGQTTDI